MDNRQATKEQIEEIPGHSKDQGRQEGQEIDDLKFGVIGLKWCLVLASMDCSALWVMRLRDIDAVL